MSRHLTHVAKLASVSTLAFCLSLKEGMAQPADTAEIETLKKQVQLLTQKIEQLENHSKQPATQAALAIPPSLSPLTQSKAKESHEGEPITAGSMPGSFKLPGSNTSVKISGYVKMDAIADVNHAYGSQFAKFATIPLENSAQAQADPQTQMHARQSRLIIETRTPTAIGDMQTMLEGDFFGSAAGNPRTTNGDGFEIRHAYGTVGKILAGQTWSNFVDTDSFPESLDYVGPAGISFIRQAQIRYTDKKDNLTYSLALENPNTDATSTSSSDINTDSVPDLTAKLRYDSNGNYVALRGLARQVKVFHTNSYNEEVDLGWGIGLSGKFKVVGKDAIMFQGAYGDGIGRYIFDVANSGNGVSDKQGEIDTAVAYGGLAGYQHYWTPTLRSNLIAGYTSIDNNVALTGTNVNKTVASGHINLIWNPVPSYKFGIEYMYGFRELENGTQGTLDRVQVSFIYLF